MDQRQMQDRPVYFYGRANFMLNDKTLETFKNKDV
jgi:hypothetical protein